MANEEPKAEGTEPAESGNRQSGSTDDKSAGVPAQGAAGATPGTRPVQARGNYPMRTITWYQINTSDIRNIGVSQVASTFFAAFGTFALSVFVELKKDIAIAPDEVKSYLESTADIWYLVWIVFWIVAAVAFFWQGNELARIKEESGVPTYRTKIKAWWLGPRWWRKKWRQANT